MEEIRIEPQEILFQHHLMLDGQSVSGCEVFDLIMRVGVAGVRMGGIGGVETKREHRNKGYSRRVLENSNRWMEESGFDCAILFGIEDYYHKFGYAVCLPQSVIEVSTRNAERAVKNLTARPFTPEDRPALHEIYAVANREQTGSIARDEKTRWFYQGHYFEIEAAAFVFTDDSGAIQAYAARDVPDDEIHVSEVGARSPAHFADIVRWAADWAIEKRIGEINFHVPHDSLFAAFLTRFGAELKIEFPHNSTGMGRLIRLVPFLEKTLSEWTRRARAVPALAPNASLRLETDIGNVTLRWTGEKVILDDSVQASGVVSLPQSRLMPFVMGYYGAELAGAFADVEARGDLSLFAALFPRRLAFMWPADYF